MAERSPTGIAPVVQLHPTRRCNLACAHCYTRSGPGATQELALALLTACLDDAAALGYRQLAVSGGEPLLYRGLGALLAHARGLGLVTSLTTNGMAATPARWAELAPLLDVVAVSIDGTPAEHDALRRRAGAFATTLAGLDAIAATGAALGLIFTLTQHNVDSLEFVVRLAAERGARSVQVHPLNLGGRASSELPDARPDAVELLAALCEASRLGESLGVAVHVDALSRAQLLAHRAHLVPPRAPRRLVDVAPVLAVLPDGAVVPLTHDVDRALWLGSLHDARLAELAARWIDAGTARRLAASCRRTWHALACDPPAAVYWYDEVAARTRDPAVRARPEPSRALVASARTNGPGPMSGSPPRLVAAA